MSGVARQGTLPSGGIVGNLPPTRWSVVARAGNRDEAAWTGALGELVTLYRPALVRHLVANMRLPPDRAEDLVQTFLADKLLHQNILQQAAREKGRFRSFLIKVFSNFVIGQLRSQQAHKRRPANAEAVPLEDLSALPSGEAGLAHAFDAVWARQVLALTLERMRAECLSGRCQQLWDLFDARVLGPLLDAVEPMPYEQLVARFGLRSPSEASNLLITAKRMFARTLHEVVRETVAADRDVDAEIRELKRVLAGL